MAKQKLYGLNAPAGFKLKEFFNQNPPNLIVVKRIEKEIISFIKSYYPKTKPNFELWYAGVTNKTNNRYNTHKRKRNVDELQYYKKFYAYSAGNARQIESILFSKYKMGNSGLMGGVYINSKYVYVFLEPIIKK